VYKARVLTLYTTTLGYRALYIRRNVIHKFHHIPVQKWNISEREHLGNVEQIEGKYLKNILNRS
jgi:hypothetical protein